MSLMQWLTKSPPTVECTPVAIATLSLVPTPSALETSTGSFHFLLSRAKSAPNPPMPPSTPGVNVRLAWWRIRCFAASASAMSTPASAYFMKVLAAFVSGEGAQRFLSFSFWRMLCAAEGGSTARYFVLLGTISLKSPEQSLPAHQAGMDQRIRVSKKALANLAGFPSVGRNVERHIYHHRRADYVFARHATPKAAVVGIAAIVAHHEITIVRNFDRGMQVVRIGAAGGVAFFKPCAVHPDGAVANIDGISRETDDSLDIVRRVRGERRLEDNYLLAMRIAPQRHVPIREGYAGIVADAAHDQVIADKQRVFHRAGRNHSRLADRAINQQKNQRYPKPGDDLALYALPHRHLGLRFLCAALGVHFQVSLHVPPPPDARSSLHHH